MKYIMIPFFIFLYRLCYSLLGILIYLMFFLPVLIWEGNWQRTIEHFYNIEHEWKARWEEGHEFEHPRYIIGTSSRYIYYKTIFHYIWKLKPFKIEET